jgi:acetyltransferase-like isoleucine patch superfamily enzyme
MKLRRLAGNALSLVDAAWQRVHYRWRRLASYLAASRCAEAGGQVFLGRQSQIAGHRWIRFQGDFAAMHRNRIEAIDAHGDRRYTPALVFGRNVTMENDCHIGAVNRIEIHDDVLIASRVYISDHAHGGTSRDDLALPPRRRPVVSKGPVVIEAEVWLGEGVVVLPNVRIGRSSIIGANSVVTHDIPPRSIVAGVPARVIRSLD